MEELDTRYQAKLAKSKSSTPPKQRIVGAPSNSRPPGGREWWELSGSELKFLLIFIEKDAKIIPNPASESYHPSSHQKQTSVLKWVWLRLEKR